MTDEITAVDTTTDAEAKAADAALWAEAVAAVKGEKPVAPAPTDAKSEAAIVPLSETDVQPEVETADQAEKEDDLWDGATEAQRQAYADLQHRLRSDNGRVGALQRQINELQRQLQAQSAPVPEQKTAADWASFEKDYPDEAKAFKALQAESDAKIDALQQQLEKLATPNDGQFYELLDAVRPDWRETVNAPEFSIWLSAQDEPTQGKLNSSRVGDAMSLLRAFDAHRDAKKAKADQIKQTREQRASNAQAIAGRSSQPSLDEEASDSEVLWREAVASVKRRRSL